MFDLHIVDFVAGGITQEEIGIFRGFFPELLPDVTPDGISDRHIKKYLRIINGSDHSDAQSDAQRNLADRLQEASRLHFITDKPTGEIDVNEVNIDRYLERSGLKLKGGSDSLREVVDWAKRGHEKAFATILELAKTWDKAFYDLKAIARNKEAKPINAIAQGASGKFPASMVERANAALNGGLDISHWIDVYQDSSPPNQTQKAWAVRILIGLKNHPEAVRFLKEQHQQKIYEKERKEAEANNLDLLIEKSKDDSKYLDAIYEMYKKDEDKKTEITNRLNQLPLEYWIAQKTHPEISLSYLAIMHHRDALACLQQLASRHSRAITAFEILLRILVRNDFQVKNQTIQAARNVNLDYWLEEAEKDPLVAGILLRFKNLGHPVANDINRINEIWLPALYPQKLCAYAPDDPVLEAFHAYCLLGHTAALGILSRIAYGPFVKEGEPPKPRIDYGKEAVKILLDIEKNQNVISHIRTEASRILDNIDFNHWIEAAKKADVKGLEEIFTTFKILSNRPSLANGIVAALKSLICLNPDEVKNWSTNLGLAIDTLEEIFTGNSRRPIFTENAGSWTLNERQIPDDSIYNFCEKISEQAASTILDADLLGPKSADDGFFRRTAPHTSDNAIALLILARRGNTHVVDYLWRHANQVQARAVYLLEQILSSPTLFSDHIVAQARTAMGKMDWTVWLRIALSQDEAKSTQAKKILYLLAKYQPGLEKRLNIIFYERGDHSVYEKVKEYFPKEVTITAMLLGALGISHLLPTSLQRAEALGHHTFASADSGSHVRSTPQTQRTRIIRQNAALRRARTFDRLKFVR